MKLTDIALILGGAYLLTKGFKSNNETAPINHEGVYKSREIGIPDGAGGTRYIDIPAGSTISAGPNKTIVYRADGTIQAEYTTHAPSYSAKEIDNLVKQKVEYTGQIQKTPLSINMETKQDGKVVYETQNKILYEGVDAATGKVVRSFDPSKVPPAGSSPPPGTTRWNATWGRYM